MTPRLAPLARAAALLGAGGTGPPPAAAPAPPATPIPAPTAVPAVFSVPEIPDYPGATRVKVEVVEGKEGYARTVSATLTSAASFETVREFYEGAIDANGWQIQGSSLRKEGDVARIAFRFSKAKSDAGVEVEARKEGGVDIRIVRKDR